MTPKDSAYSAAERRVELLLRTLDEARVDYDPRAPGEGGPAVMPTIWNEGSYAELERCLLLMREGGEDLLLDPTSGLGSFGRGGFAVTVMRSPERQLWWHLSSRYRWGEHRVLLVRVQRRRQGAHFLMPACSELVAGGPSAGSKKALVRAYCWSEHVDQGLADEGVRYLTTLMHHGRKEKIRLPDVLLRRWLGLPVEDDRIEEEVVAV
jgi:hypothetical protein